METTRWFSRLGSREQLGGLLAGGLILGGLSLTSLSSYPLFHSLAEVFSILVAFGAFMIAWDTRRLTDIGFFLFLGIAALAAGGLDLVHTLAYKGMGVFPGYDANLPTQLWIAARALQAVSFLVAPWFLARRCPPWRALFAYAVVVTLVLVAIFSGRFPTCFVEGVGLTRFKVVSEYVISGILLAALGLLGRQRQAFPPHVWRMLRGAILLTVGSELAFTFYVSVYGLSNLVGHLFKILAFYCLYRAIVRTGLTDPVSLLFRTLTQSKEAASARTHQMETVRAIGEEMTRELDWRAVLDLIMQRAVALLGASAGMLRVWDAAAGLLIPQSWVGADARYASFSLRLGEGVAGQVAQRRQGLLVNDFRTSTYATPALLAGPYTAVLAEPLLYQDRLVGVLSVGNGTTERPFTPDDQALLRLFADQAAIAIENARLFTELTHSMQEALQEGARRHQAEDDLRTSRALLQAVVEGTSDTVFVKDLQGRYLLFNAAAEQFTGKRPAETLGHDDHFLFPPAEAAALMAGDRAVLAGGQITTTEDVLPDAAGAHHTFLSTRGPLADAAGQPIGLFGILRDITERKQAEDVLQASLAEKEVLLREVHHRVKNNLAAIIGLLSLQRRGLADPAAVAALADLETRIHSMALVHAQLYQAPDLARIDAQAYLTMLLAHLRTALGSPRHVRCVVAAMPVTLSMETAIPCGMIVTELVTNALKYAFPGGTPRPGEPDCALTVALAQDGDTITLTVADNGVGLPAALDWTTTPTLGLRLVQMLGQHQLGGQVTVDRTAGTRVQLQFASRKEG